MTEKWYIDAMDPRAGLGFVSRRAQETSGVLSIPEETLSAFIGPPTFTPEFLGARSVGYALARGHGQVGLFRQDGGEVGFKSLGAVAEFLRRVYLRGSSGDTPGEGGRLWPRLPVEGDAPAGIPPIEGESAEGDFVAAARRVADENLKLSSHLALDDSAEASRLDFSAASSVNTHRLARGALRILLELVRRAPKSATDPDFEWWLRIFGRFWEMVLRMGLRPQVRNELAVYAKYFYGGSISDWLNKQHHHVSQPLLSLLFSLDAPLEPSWWYAAVFRVSASLQPSGEPFSDLAQLPVPAKIASAIPAESATLQSLLSAVAATPAEMLASDVEERAELVLFAAAYLNVGADRPPLLLREYFSSNTYSHFPELLVARAVKWLGSNLPKLVYEKTVEEIITSASSLVRPIPAQQTSGTA